MVPNTESLYTLIYLKAMASQESLKVLIIFWVNFVLNHEYHHILQKDSPSEQQLHLAALQGNVDLLRKVLQSAKVHVDCKDKVCMIENIIHYFYCANSVGINSINIQIV